MPLPPGWKVLGTTHLLGLPLPVWIGWAAVLAASILLAHTVFGREIYAAGSHPQAAQLNGQDAAAAAKTASDQLDAFLAGYQGAPIL